MCSLSEPTGDTGRSRADPGGVHRVLLGDAPRYTKAEVARIADVELSRAEQLWQAMGFAHVTDDAVAFTDADVEALGMLVQLVSAEVITPELETAVARSLARTMARLADWQLDIFQSVLGESFATDRETTAEFAEAVVPVMGRLQEYVWRRHLASAASRELTRNDPRTQVHTQVVGFADLVGYTRLIRDFSEIELGRLIDDFEGLATGVVAQNHGQIVKTVGDEVLFVAPSVSEAAEIGLRLHEVTAEASDVPPLRIGMAMGPVLGRFGDVYGSTVNIASRLTSLAKPATVLVDAELASPLRQDPRFDLIPIGSTKVRGFRGLRAWVLRRSEQRTSDDTAVGG